MMLLILGVTRLIKTLLRKGEIRSLLPGDIKVLAMNATKIKSHQLQVSEVISLVNPIVLQSHNVNKSCMQYPDSLLHQSLLI